MKRAISPTLFLLCSAVPSWGQGETPSPFPEDCWGVYTWNTPDWVDKQTCPLIKGFPVIVTWDRLEPEPGRYEFDRLIGDRLIKARDNGFYTFVKVYVAPKTPRWLYENGVPEVKVEETISPFRKPRAGWTFPYYFDEEYIRYYYRMIRAVGAYLRGLPDDLRGRVLFVQSAEGTTGDGGFYKGNPLDPRYNIIAEEWRGFRVKVWEVFKEALQEGPGPKIPLAVNDDANREEEHAWLLANLDVIGAKQGMFSHGYVVSDIVERVDRWRALTARAESAGKTTFTRGEEDQEFNIVGWITKNRSQALYWSGLFALHCGLDMWNLPAEACKDDTYKDAIDFFNRYAGRHDPATSANAFCALRRGLDASDTRAFPEESFGKADKKDADRYLKIAEAFSPKGAIQGDPEKAIGNGMVNRQADDYNDVGWGTFPGNYGRFLEQIDPDATSVGWWHAGPQDSCFSRFARGFEHASGKTALRFRLDDRFFAEPSQPHGVRVRVVYLDRGRGTWALRYAGRGSVQTAFEGEGGDTGQWVEKTVDLDEAFFARRLAGGADLALEYVSGDDTLFHMIEVAKRP